MSTEPPVPEGNYEILVTAPTRLLWLWWKADCAVKDDTGKVVWASHPVLARTIQRATDTALTYGRSAANHHSIESQRTRPRREVYAPEHHRPTVTPTA